MSEPVRDRIARETFDRIATLQDHGHDRSTIELALRAALSEFAAEVINETMRSYYPETKAKLHA